jgi:TRAP-type C4-dicarboxylate transport system permease small subunit
MRGPVRLGGVLARVYDRLYSVLGALAAIAFAVMAVSISVDVIVRNLGLGTIPWINEAAEYVQYAAVFCGVPWVLRLGAHVRVDMILRTAPPRLAGLLEALANLFGVAISAILLWFAVEVGRAAWRDGALVIKSFVFPEWWVFALLAVSAFLLLVEFVRRLWAARPTTDARAPSL